MLKKAEVIDALNNGAHILVNDIYRSATVWTADGQQLGTCRFDTAQRLGKTEGFKIRKLDAWSFSWKIEKDQPETIKEQTSFDWDDIRALCIEKRWYTRGTNAEYENLYSMVKAGADLEDLARDIYNHSSQTNGLDVDTVRAALLDLTTEGDIVSNQLKKAIPVLERGDHFPVDWLSLDEIRWLKSEYGDKLCKTNVMTDKGPRGMLYVCW